MKHRDTIALVNNFFNTKEMAKKKISYRDAVKSNPTYSHKYRIGEELEQPFIGAALTPHPGDGLLLPESDYVNLVHDFAKEYPNEKYLGLFVSVQNQMTVTPFASSNALRDWYTALLELGRYHFIAAVNKDDEHSWPTNSSENHPWMDSYAGNVTLPGPAHIDAPPAPVMNTEYIDRTKTETITKHSGTGIGIALAAGGLFGLAAITGRKRH